MADIVGASVAYNLSVGSLPASGYVDTVVAPDTSSGRGAAKFLVIHWAQCTPGTACTGLQQDVFPLHAGQQQAGGGQTINLETLLAAVAQVNPAFFMFAFPRNAGDPLYAGSADSLGAECQVKQIAATGVGSIGQACVLALFLQ